LGERPVRVEVEAVEAAERINVADLSVGIPEGWEKQSFSRTSNTSGRLKVIAVCGLNTFVLEFLYGELASWVSFPDPATIEESMPQVSTRLVNYLQEYDTDIELFDAIYNVTATKIKYASSEARAKHLTALMYQKVFLPLPGMRMQTKSLTAYGALRPDKRKHVFVGYLFDAKGMLRGIVTLGFPEGVEPKEAEKVLGQMLYNAEFVGEGSPPDEAE